jgi:hypothetical protein
VNFVDKNLKHLEMMLENGIKARERAAGCSSSRGETSKRAFHEHWEIAAARRLGHVVSLTIGKR